jgi:GNAT superfamily N-acetyltransferase
MLVQAYRILKRSFPSSELVRLADFLGSLTARAAGYWADLLWHVIVVEQGRLLTGVVTGAYLTAINVGFVGYLAVDRALRAQGVGHRLRNRLLDVFQRDAWRRHHAAVHAIVGEIEPDNPWLVTLVRDHNAIALDLPYVQPPVRPGGDAVPLVLYYQPLGAPRSTIPTVEVGALLYHIWRHAYQVVRPWQDPLFTEMLAAIADRDEIGGRTLTTLEDAATG